MLTLVGVTPSEDPGHLDERARPGPLRGAWVALVGAEHAAGLERRVHDPAGLLVAPDSVAFARFLEELRPRIALVEVPPARAEDASLAIQERRRRATLRIVHLTPPQAIRERVAALEDGFDEALAASISTDELVDRLDLLARRAGARPNGAHVFRVADDAELDLVAHELRRGGELVHLRPREFRLLALLAGHPGRAYTRRQLLDRAWGPDHDADPRTVDVHICWLRSKVERDPERPAHIVTVRGLGYRLDPPKP